MDIQEDIGLSPQRLQRWGIFMLISIVGFLILGTLAIQMYPGGNIFDRSVKGYHFWHNFVCDALDKRAWNGQANIWSSRLGLLGITWLALGALLPCWLIIPYGLSTRKRWSHTIRTAGLLCIAGLFVMLGEAFVRMPLSHTTLIALAGVPGFVATLLFLYVMFTEKGLPLYIPVLGVLALTASIINMVLYLRVQWWGKRLTPLLPTSQKYAMFFLLLWLGSIAYLCITKSRAHQRQTSPQHPSKSR